MNKKMGSYIFTLLTAALLAVLSACGNSTGSSETEASSYPEKPIKISVGFPAGAVTDTVTRTIAESLTKQLPNEVDVAVENKPGGGGVVAVTDIVNSNPNGYEIGFTPNGPLTMHTHYGNTAYDYDDPTLISQVIVSDFILAVHPDSEWKSFEEFLESTKDNPGSVSIGTPGDGSRPDLIMDQLKEQAGMDVNSVPFEGNAPARTALMGKDVDAVILTETDILPYAESGELKALLNFGEKEFDDIPTAQEKGYDLNASAIFFFYGPNDMPKEIVQALDGAIQKAIDDPAVVESFEQVGFDINYKSSEEITEIIKMEYEQLGKLINGSS
ncbi:Tripartite-type tricarboxylate transporter, receptor component TctC [Alteribacillus persepolensis]|uniref:Tripartite-type tricarboxylate transporter, receptor component TctC n=1 Tax=Alteribacillus persepolensis TaxID=568899 RepID=A0A1G8A7I6_9BACI|nr:tripartite tricarboxylate transporter substrate binding protein [Alteribacillus persepolensis]SDH16843.1 Tripartite-type tricarboxylate transporter, receptor component TctC [Alteribacillus persepolensis]